MKALKDSHEEFQEFFRGSTALIKMLGDKIFLAISNLYFFNISKGIRVDFSAVFHPILVPDSKMYSIKAAAAQQGEYLVEKPGLNF